MPAGDAGREQQPVRLVVDLPRVGHRRGCPDGTEPRHHACWFDEGGSVVRVRKASREEMAAEIDRLQAQLAAQQAVVDAAREFVDDDPCRYDHNDYCQTHYGQRPCHMERLRVALDAQAAQPEGEPR